MGKIGKGDEPDDLTPEQEKKLGGVFKHVLNTINYPKGTPELENRVRLSITFSASIGTILSREQLKKIKQVIGRDKPWNVPIGKYLADNYSGLVAKHLTGQGFEVGIGSVKSKEFPYSEAGPQIVYDAIMTAISEKQKDTRNL